MILKKVTRSGFTLVEMLAVIIAIAIAATIAAGSISLSIKNRRLTETERELELLAAAIIGHTEAMQAGRRSDFGYVGDVGSFPPTLSALWSNSGGYATWRGPYLPCEFEGDTVDLMIDQWGSAYNYLGGIQIVSRGSGTDITKKIATSPDDYLVNTLSGVIRDAAEFPPGNLLKDSISVLITFPDGRGGLTTTMFRPDSCGNFLIDSLPVGRHLLRLIYAPASDTLTRYVTILPRHKGRAEYRFAYDYFLPGDDSHPGIEILRPSGAGIITELDASGGSANWECVDEEINDGDFTYVYEAASAFSEDSYEIGDHTTGSGRIDSLKIVVSCIGFGGNSRAATKILTDGNSQEGYIIKPTTSQYTYYETNYRLNPITGMPWAWSQIDSLEIGLRLRAAAGTQVWAEVYYTP